VCFERELGRVRVGIGRELPPPPPPPRTKMASAE
jgi:hypothetical protein